MPEGKKVTRLSGLDALEVSLVPRGANKRVFLIKKEEEGETMNEILKSLLESASADDAVLTEKVDELIAGFVSKEEMKDKDKLEAMKAAMKGAVKLLQGLGKQMPKDGDKVMEELVKLAGMKVEKQEGTMNAEDQKKLDVILKANEDLKSENKTLKEEIAKERDVRIAKEFEEKAHSFGYRGDKCKEVGLVLKNAAEKFDTDTYGKFEAVVKENAVRAETLRELGSSQAFKPLDAETKIEKAKEAIMKEDSKLSDAQAYDLALQRNPGLYREYCEQQELRNKGGN